MLVTTLMSHASADATELVLVVAHQGTAADRQGAAIDCLRAAADRQRVVVDRQGATADRQHATVDRPGAASARQGATVDHLGATTDRQGVITGCQDVTDLAVSGSKRLLLRDVLIVEAIDLDIWIFMPIPW
jgi:hypothetical protein